MNMQATADAHAHAFAPCPSCARRALLTPIIFATLADRDEIARDISRRRRSSLAGARRDSFRVARCPRPICGPAASIIGAAASSKPSTCREEFTSLEHAGAPGVSIPRAAHFADRRQWKSSHCEAGASLSRTREILITAHARCFRSIVIPLPRNSGRATSRQCADGLRGLLAKRASAALVSPTTSPSLLSNSVAVPLQKYEHFLDHEINESRRR